MNLPKWQAKGQDQHSVIADPLFEGPQKGDFKLKPGSPASQIEFKAIDLTGAGASGIAQPPAVPSAFPTIP